MNRAFSISVLYRILGLLLLGMALNASHYAQNKYEGRPLGEIAITDAGGGPLAAAEDFRSIAVDSLGAVYSTTKIHDAIVALYATKRISTINVVANEVGDSVGLRFEIKLKAVVDKVSIELIEGTGDKVTEEELLFKLNILQAGTPLSDAALKSNADVILDYLRGRGFYQSEVTYTQTPVTTASGVSSSVVFTVKPNAQAAVETFKITIDGLKTPILPEKLDLRTGELFWSERLDRDVEKIREILRDQDFVAPTLNQPSVRYDSEKNTISIEIVGKVGPTVRISFEPDEAKVGTTTQRRLLPVLREGTLDYAAIVEGERRLENYYQENGYFFADVTPICTVTPPVVDSQNEELANETEFLCQTLASYDLLDRTVDIKYRADLNRKLELTRIRVRGTDKFTVDDIRAILKSQEATPLGYIPFFGFGRGLTSENILEEDVNSLRSVMNELGYREAIVRANRGASAVGDDLIITFDIEEGPKTVVKAVTIVGNTAVDTATLLAQTGDLTGTNFSRAKFRNAVRKIAAYYSENGYYDARVSYSFEELPSAADADQKEIKLEFKISNEGKKVIINRVLATGYEKTKPGAILRAATLRSGEFLKAADVYQTEQNLYSTDAFDRVDVKPQSIGTGTNGERQADVVIGVNEQPARLITYGGGYSTDIGANGFVDLRHFNLFGNLWQGGVRFRGSPRQQLFQIDFVNPRFIPDGDKRFAPLTITAQYQRDSTVTRFFRSAFDKGAFGIVQRINEEGNPIDDFGAETSSPTINRLTFTAETSRTISRKTRSILFARYKFEDVRIFNVESLLIKNLLRPDSRVRTSGISLTFVRDTRENCSVQTSFLELLARGEPNARCKYSASDPTHGSYFVTDYNLSLRELGANISFQKFQASYNYYYTFSALRNTTIAARGILGLASAFSAEDRFPAQFADLNDLLPISERFFAGGSNTLRGFDFEEAGPRVVVIPQGIFRNSQGEPVTLNPFSIPFGGNALAIVNVEARIPLSNSVRAVPFYDGGNVFRRIRDIFKAPDAAPNDVVRQNLRALWTNTVGLGLRIKTPVGGEFGVDYGYLLNPPRFLIPQPTSPNAIHQLQRSQIHFRFSQAF